MSQESHHEASIASQIVEQLAQSIAEHGKASFVVCGGSSPLGIFTALASGSYRTRQHPLQIGRVSQLPWWMTGSYPPMMITATNICCASIYCMANWQRRDSCR